MLVIDASAATELLLARPAADAVAGHISERGLDLHAPHLIDVEIVSAVRRWSPPGDARRRTRRGGDRRPSRSADGALPPRHPAARVSGICARTSPRTTPPTWRWPRRLSDEGVPLLTTDARLARAVRAHTAIEVLSA